MTARRGATGLAGVMLVDKPAGPTSHDIVATIRRATGERRVGHAGTLDPMATGLLIVLIGRAARLARYLTGQDKRYEARIAFGTQTDTLDAEGATTATMPVPACVTDPAYASGLLSRLVGPSEQLPPAYSAIKTGGVSAHRLARAGMDPGLASRPIVVHEAALKAVSAEPPAWDVTFAVSKGTYIRSLARDIGDAAGTAAHLAALRRTAIGDATLAEAHTLAEVVVAAEAGQLETVLTDPAPLLGMPVLPVDPAEVRDGRPLDAPSLDATTERVALTADGLLLGIYRREGDRLRAETVFDPGVPR